MWWKVTIKSSKYSSNVCRCFTGEKSTPKMLFVQLEIEKGEIGNLPFSRVFSPSKDTVLLFDANLTHGAGSLITSPCQSTSAPWDFPLKWEILSLRCFALQICCNCKLLLCLCWWESALRISSAGCPTCPTCRLRKSGVVVDASLHPKPRHLH